MVERHRIRALEERALNAWPARQTVFHDGWVFRLSDGYTKRANSANALTPQGDFSRVRVAAELLYARHSLPTIFRLTPLAPDGADKALDDLGYEHLDPTIVMTLDMSGDIDGDANGEPDIAISAIPTPEWCAGFAAAHNIAPGARQSHDRIVSSIAPLAAFATIARAGRPVGYGIAVTDNRMMGLFDIVVIEGARNAGVGRTLTRALLRWGRSQGAAGAYLQVTTKNTIAHTLYSQLGFKDVYRYHYRRRM